MGWSDFKRGWKMFWSCDASSRIGMKKIKNWDEDVLKIGSRNSKSGINFFRSKIKEVIKVWWQNSQSGVLGVTKMEKKNCFWNIIKYVS